MEPLPNELTLLKAMHEWAGLSPGLGPTNPRLNDPPRPGWLKRAVKRLLGWLADGMIVVGTRLKAAYANGVEPKPARPGAV